MKTISLTPKKVILLAIALTAGIGGGFAYKSLNPVSPYQNLWQATLTDTQNQPKRIDDWKGKVRVINFWATWCPPCKEEIPSFIALQHQRPDIQVIGLAIDQTQAADAFAKQMRVNYPILIAEQAGLGMMKSLGNTNTGLPFTVVIDEHGRLISNHQGLLTLAQLQAIAPHK